MKEVVQTAGVQAQTMKCPSESMGSMSNLQRSRRLHPAACSRGCSGAWAPGDAVASRKVTSAGNRGLFFCLKFQRLSREAGNMSSLSSTVSYLGKQLREVK